MIFYYSATGNSKHVALQLAQATEDTVCSIEDCLRAGETSFDLRGHERIGFVTPVYFLGLPRIMERFLTSLTVRTQDFPYVYAVYTFGNFSGTAPVATQRALRKQGLELAASFGVSMVDTWTPLYDTSDAVKNREVEKDADAFTVRMAERIQAKAAGNVHLRLGPPVVDAIVHTWSSRRQHTATFTVENTCTGCGSCARDCPIGAISLQDGKPVWTVPQCEACLRCLHRCPTFAIQRGRNTKKHGQYVHPSSNNPEA